VTRRYEQIAETLGAGPWRVFSTVTLPLAAREHPRGRACSASRVRSASSARRSSSPAASPDDAHALRSASTASPRRDRIEQAAVLLVISISIAFVAVLGSNRLAREDVVAAFDLDFTLRQGEFTLTFT
jgi:molybdate transport system permease protein